MKTLLILIALSSTLAAFPAKLKWNKNPEADLTEYRIWQIMPDGSKVLKQTVAADALAPADPTKIVSQAFEMQSGEVYTVTAFNGLESEPADPLTIPKVPSKPQGLMVFEFQVTTTLEPDKWQPVAFFPVKPGEKVEFMRGRMTTIQVPQ